MLTWSDVCARLAGAKNYWLHTTGPQGTPNATPVWGAVLAERIYLYTRSTTVKARNLRSNPRVALHLESAEDVLIVHGDLEYLGHPQGRPDVLESLAEKYDQPWEIPFLPSSDPVFDVLYALEPRSAITWSLPDTAASTRRWRRP